MSWKTLNHVLGLASVDQAFWQALQKDPVAAIEAQGFILCSEERNFLSGLIVTDLADLSRALQDRFRPGLQHGIA